MPRMIGLAAAAVSVVGQELRGAISIDSGWTSFTTPVVTSIVRLTASEWRLNNPSLATRPAFSSKLSPVNRNM